MAHFFYLHKSIANYVYSPACGKRFWFFRTRQLASSISPPINAEDPSARTQRPFGPHEEVLDRELPRILPQSEIAAFKRVMWQEVRSDQKPATPPQNYDYHYHCEFAMVGCQVKFDPPHKNQWMLHSISHFGKFTPPLDGACIFCDAVFRTQDDPHDCWRKRLLHIASHYENLERLEKSRPDYFLLDYLRETNLLNAEDYNYAIKFSERPRADGLVQPWFETQEMRLKKERIGRQEHDLQRERRRIRKKWRNGTESSRSSRSSRRSETSLR
jgi:hypothetical protein